MLWKLNFLLKKFLQEMKKIAPSINNDKGRKCISQGAWAEIQAFRQIKHIRCSEVVEQSNDEPIEYDTVIFDTYA